jgi:hypothetical protein
MNLKLYVVSLLALNLTSCTTIPIREQDAFENKKTVSIDMYRQEGRSVEQIHVPVTDTMRLEAWYIQQYGSRGTVLYFGGNGFLLVTSHHILTGLLDQNVNLFVFDYRGYGRNPGVPSVEALKTDGLAMYDYLTKTLGVDASSLVLHGHSMGSFLSLFVARQREASGLVLESPVTDVEDWMDRLVPFLLKPLVSFDIDTELKTENNVRRIETVSIPVLIVVGDEDNITPKSMSETLFETAGSKDKTLAVIKGGGHNDLPGRQDYSQALDRFFSSVWDEKMSD